jgi:hypothetical protein
VSIFDCFVNTAELLLEIFNWFLWLIIIISGLLLLLLFSLLRLLLLFLGAFFFNWIFESKVYRNLIEFLEVARHWNLDNRRIVFQVEEQLI